MGMYEQTTIELYTHFHCTNMVMWHIILSTLTVQTWLCGMLQYPLSLYKHGYVACYSTHSHYRNMVMWHVTVPTLTIETWLCGMLQYPLSL